MGIHAIAALLIIAQPLGIGAPGDGGSVLVVPEVAGVAHDGGGGRSGRLGMRPTRVSLDFRNADVHNVLRLLAAEGRVNIVVGPEVRGTVTMTLKNVLVADAFRAVLGVNGLSWERVGEIILVRKR